MASKKKKGSVGVMLLVPIVLAVFFFGIYIGGSIVHTHPSMETAGGGGARDEGMRCVGLGLVRALPRETRRDETRRER